jgi:hypothetical protein
MKSGERRNLYGCMYHHKRGVKVCRNPVLIRQEKLDRVVLESIAEALDARILERAVEKAAVKLRRRPQAIPERRAQVERELADVEARLQRGLDALLAGMEAADELRGRLKVEKDRRAALTAELETLKKGRGPSPSSTTRASCRRSALACATCARCSARTSPGRVRSSGSCSWAVWSAERSPRAAGWGIASPGKARTPS